MALGNPDRPQLIDLAKPRIGMDRDGYGKFIDVLITDHEWRRPYLFGYIRVSQRA